jgi:ubiquinone/menaquinone biosynthesis C-methylase UbiE
MTHAHANHGKAEGETAGNAWKDERLVAAFVEQTAAQAEQRRALFDFTCDLFPFERDAGIRVLDIGAGYGAFAEAVLEYFPNATVVGLDISEPMIAVGRERMARFGDRFSYHVGDFAGGELPPELPGPLDAAVASASILHLQTDQKQWLYADVFRILNPGGCFFNVEPVAPANEEMEGWYRERRGRQYQRREDLTAPLAEHSFMQHHSFESEEAYQAHQRHHHVETEASQLAFLREAGFVRVDCFYKKLLEAVIGGYKPG